MIKTIHPNDNLLLSFLFFSFLLFYPRKCLKFKNIQVPLMFQHKFCFSFFLTSQFPFVCHGVESKFILLVLLVNSSPPLLTFRSIHYTVIFTIFFGYFGQNCHSNSFTFYKILSLKFNMRLTSFLRFSKLDFLTLFVTQFSVTVNITLLYFHSLRDMQLL